MSRCRKSDVRSRALPRTTTCVECETVGGVGVGEVNENASANREREQRQGGGVAIGIEKSLTYRDLSDLIPPAFAELEALLVQVVHECFEVLVLNVYASHFSRKRKLFAPLG